ncbi:cutinase family protein [Nocardia sp. NPDC052112]|uniref:cutinase family protein n=1 Tax=Nocardia sp. NPDC052112 TaxID=3155646 RepID=UPI00342367BD
MHTSTIRDTHARRTSAPNHTLTGIVAASTIVASIVASGSASAQSPSPDAPLDTTCPALYALGVQGPEESSPDAASTTDTGALGGLFAPMLSAAQGLAQRAYIPYGTGEDGTEQPYDQSVATASGRVEDTAAEIVRRCPTTKIAVAGYAQGAAAVAAFAKRVGTGTAKIGADQVAGIALLANPARAGDTAVLPGRPGATTPTAAPATTGTQVSKIAFTDTVPAGSGIARTADTSASFGSLTGRVADFCVAGDITCAAPSEGPLATTVANIAAQSDLRDPVAAISTIAQAFAATVYKTAVGVVHEDVHGNSLDQLSYEPSKSISQRLAEASNPATPLPGPDQAIAALMRIGTIALNAVTAVAQTVFTPETITELATVGMTDPLAAIATLGTKLAAAVVELVPPQTGIRLINQAFEAITTNVTDNTQLYNIASSAQYSDTSGRHGSYTGTAATPTGQSPAMATAAWFAAAAHDIAAITPPATPAPTTTTAVTTTTAPTTTPAWPTATAAATTSTVTTSPAGTTPAP